MIKKLIIILLLFVIGCSTYNVSEISLVVNGVEVDSRIIDRYFVGDTGIFLTFTNQEQVSVINYSMFGYENRKQPRKIFVTLTEVEFEEFIKVVERC